VIGSFLAEYLDLLFFADNVDYFDALGWEDSIDHSAKS